jgi:hypothetical protein
MARGWKRVTIVRPSANNPQIFSLFADKLNRQSPSAVGNAVGTRSLGREMTESTHVVNLSPLLRLIMLSEPSEGKDETEQES